MTGASKQSLTAAEALERLREGNRRFVDGRTESQQQAGQDRRAGLVAGQSPFAIILGCSDSRVPAELVFDRDLGDLFVIRVAGNIVARSQIGSVEFAAQQLGTPLVVVLGHSGCGAVKAAIDELRQPAGPASQNLGFIVGRIQPCLRHLCEAEVLQGEELMREAVRANIRASVEQLKAGSEIVRDKVASGSLMIVGAEYSLESGAVEFLED